MDGIGFLGFSYFKELLCHLSVLEASSISNKKGGISGAVIPPPPTYLVVEGTSLPPGPSEPCRSPMRQGSPEPYTYWTSEICLLCGKGRRGFWAHMLPFPLCSDVSWPSLTERKLKDEIMKFKTDGNHSIKRRVGPF